MANKWIKHLQQFRQKNKDKDLNPQQVMKEARKSYQSGGGPLSQANSAVRQQSSRVMSNGRRLLGGGMEVTPFPQSNLASTASALGQQGGKRRKSQRRSTKKSRQTRRR